MVNRKEYSIIKYMLENLLRKNKVIFLPCIVYKNRFRVD